MIVDNFLQTVKEVVGDKVVQLEPLVKDFLLKCASFYSEEEALVVLDRSGEIVGYNELFLEWSQIEPKGKNFFDFVDKGLEGILKEQLEHGSVERSRAQFLFKEPLEVDIKIERLHCDSLYRLLYLKKREFDNIHYQLQELQRQSAELVLRIKDFDALLNELLRLFVSSPLFDFALVTKVDMQRKRIIPKFSAGDRALEEVVIHKSYDFGYFASLLEVLISGEDFVTQDVEVEGVHFKKQVILPLFNKWDYKQSEEISYLVLLFSQGKFTLDSYSKRILREILYKINVALADILLKEKAAAIVDSDPLTSLPKRERLFKELQCCLDEEISFAIAVVDIDKLRKVNDVLGFWAGDKALKSLAAHLKQLDALSVRYGSDEFALLIKGDRSHIYAVLDEVMAFNERLVAINGSEVFLPVSVGVSFYPEDATKSEELLLMAEAAVKRAKEHGGKSIVYANQEKTLLPKDYLELEKELKEALKAKEYEMYYQPIIDIQSCKVWGSEALLRWKSKKRGIVSPGVFIPILEESGLINDVGEEIIKQVVQTLKEIASKDLYLTFSMNISVTQFLSKNIAKEIIERIHRCQADPKRLIVEVTESVLMENFDSVEHQIELLQKEGIRIEIDDFGTGYSSLAYLKNLPISALKIDRSFVKEMVENQADLSIIKAIVSIAKALGKEVIAEGVEDQKTLEKLQELGVNYVQGFFFAKPMPKSEFLEFVENFDYTSYFK